MPLTRLGITRANLDALYFELRGVIPTTSREDFPAFLLQLVEAKTVKILVTAQHIQVEIEGSVTRYVPKA
jgi:hypothetical protein